MNLLDDFENEHDISYDLETLSQKYQERLFTPEAIRLRRAKQDREAPASVAEGSD